ncbi:MAG: hypothetical protein JO142_11875, partial [Burkholderiales bacterium]|nr:hypothetical protein [Burkholderiales bacterium]
DAAKIRPLNAQQLAALTLPPAQGGLLLDLRVAPYLFTQETDAATYDTRAPSAAIELSPK